MTQEQNHLHKNQVTQNEYRNYLRITVAPHSSFQDGRAPWEAQVMRATSSSARDAEATGLNPIGPVDTLICLSGKVAGLGNMLVPPHIYFQILSPDWFSS